MNVDTPTLMQYAHFEEAYAALNLDLFQGQLPDVMLTVAPSRHETSYMRYDIFQERPTEAGDYYNGGEEAKKYAEIGINARMLSKWDEATTLRILIVEMIRLAEAIAGRPTTNRYVTKAMRDRAYAIGLSESDSAVGGWFAAGGSLAHRAIASLIESGWRVRYAAEGAKEGGAGEATKSRSSKVRYVCPVTGVKVWGRSGLLLYTHEGSILECRMLEGEQGNEQEESE
jgi:hypothetical protein